FSISNHFSLTLGLERFVKSDSVSAAASSSLKIGVVVCDSEARPRNRCFGMWDCDRLSHKAL
ncbi:MAG: hypothetical protein ACLBM6_02545, partial [Cuspidothrix sp.]